MRHQISLLVPFQEEDTLRVRTWKWLHRYWTSQLPGAEIVIGTDPKSQKRWYRPNTLPFSKSTAVNNAFRKSHGDIIVILDADAYFDAKVIDHCARRLRAAREVDARIWFIPFRWLYRLKKHASREVEDTCAEQPWWISTPPPHDWIEGTHGSGQGQKFGALCQIMPREAFEFVGGMDERFRGWGGEDVSFLHALDTLWGEHVNTSNEILHLWHSKKHSNAWDGVLEFDHKARIWSGQLSSQANDWLAIQYTEAAYDRPAMQDLVDEGHKKKSLRKRLGR